MFVKREKIFWKKQGIHKVWIKRESYWLFGFIPLYIKNTIVGRT